MKEDEQNIGMAGNDSASVMGASNEDEADVVRSTTDELRGGRSQITEEEARELLIQENWRMREEERKASKSGKRVLVFVLILAVLMVALGIGFSMMAKEREKTEVVSGESGVGEGMGEEDEGVAVELDINSDEVQGLYQAFGDSWNWVRFLTGKIEENTMAAVAINSLTPQGCVGDGDYYDNYGSRDICYDGKDVMAKIKEYFGREIEFNEDMPGARLYQCTMYYYNAEVNEFYKGVGGCSGTLSGLQKKLIKAEKSKDSLVLYEVATWFKHVLIERYGLTLSGIYEVQYYDIGDMGDWGEQNEVVTIKYEMTDEMNQVDLDEINAKNDQNFLDNLDKLNQFKWTFRLNDEGNYIFEKLEKVEDVDE